MANSSNNTIFADADGDIAYWHGNFIPKPRPQIRLHQTRRRLRPRHRLARPHPARRDPAAQEPRQRLALQRQQLALERRRRKLAQEVRLPRLRRARHRISPRRPRHAPALNRLRKTSPSKASSPPPSTATSRGSPRPSPHSLKAYDALPTDAPTSHALHDQIDLLRKWDYRWERRLPIATSLAVYWGTEINRTAGAAARRAGIPSEDFVAANATPDALLAALATATAKLTADFGKWQTPWGEHQPLPAPHRRHRPALQRRRPQHPRPLRLQRLGLARLLRRARNIPARRSGTAPAATASSPSSSSAPRSTPAPSPPAAKAATPSRQTLQRRGPALRQRQPPRGLLLPRPAQSPHRTNLQPRPVKLSDALQRGSHRPHDRHRPYALRQRGLHRQYACRRRSASLKCAWRYVSQRYATHPYASRC